jgi:hypothetical protein
LRVRVWGTGNGWGVKGWGRPASATRWPAVQPERTSPGSRRRHPPAHVRLRPAGARVRCATARVRPRRGAPAGGRHEIMKPLDRANRHPFRLVTRKNAEIFAANPGPPTHANQAVCITTCPRDSVPNKGSSPRRFQEARNRTEPPITAESCLVRSATGRAVQPQSACRQSIRTDRRVVWEEGPSRGRTLDSLGGWRR